MPAIVAVGLWAGATTATAAAVGTAVVATGVSVAATGYGMYAQNKAAHQAASVDNAVSDYNAKYDRSLSAQLDLDTQQNVRVQRAEDATYLSRQQTSYAASGVLANTGSALDAQIQNAGRMEQKIQQEWVNSNQRQQQYNAAANFGVLEGNARASADRMSGNLALINGGAKIFGQGISAYQSGVFSGFGSQSVGDYTQD